MASNRQCLDVNPELAVPDARDIDAIIHADHADPFSVLGPHRVDDVLSIRTFQPDASRAEVVHSGGQIVPMRQIGRSGFFTTTLPIPSGRFDYQLRIHNGEHVALTEDPYRFGPCLGELDEYLFREGTYHEAYNRLGAQAICHEGIDGISFAVWAPNARRVSVVGDFNGWDGRRHPMRCRFETGLWEIFIPSMGPGCCYKYEVKSQDGRILPLKADPYAQATEPKPGTASKVHRFDHHWRDDTWLAKRKSANHAEAPMSIYEVHLGSWRRGVDQDHAYLSYRDLTEQLIPYVKEMGFTHIEILPITDYPFDGSWGYQPTSLFAPTSRFGTPTDFQQFVDSCHLADIGIILDWVPAHFPDDAFGLACFDGTHLFEHADPDLGRHPDWKTLIYNFGRTEVATFLHNSALFWLDRFHIDALRVDAVSSMLYLDYSREPGQWRPNQFGGNENLEAIDFIKHLNQLVADNHQGAMVIAEESTSWAGVSRPIDEGGLGFGLKWNLGWMHDTLSYMELDPVHRRYHHNKMTFGLLYQYSENFVLPLGHDEVVHGKGSLLGRMPGDEWQRFANLRAYYTFMWAHPGKKLLFMGGEFAQYDEWNHDKSLDWHLLDYDPHKGVQRLVRDLNQIYRDLPALHRLDHEPLGFSWLDADASDESVFLFVRSAGDTSPLVLVACNFTPVPRHGYRIGVPSAGPWIECLNSDNLHYGGSGMINQQAVEGEPIGCHGQPFSILVDLPPLAGAIFKMGV